MAAWEIICYLLVNCHQYNLRVEYCYLRSVKVKTTSSFDPSSIFVQCKLHCTLWHDCGRLDTSFACEVWLKSLISQHKCVMIIIDHMTISSFIYSNATYFLHLRRHYLIRTSQQYSICRFHEISNGMYVNIMRFSQTHTHRILVMSRFNLVKVANFLCCNKQYY